MKKTIYRKYLRLKKKRPFTYKFLKFLVNVAFKYILRILTYGISTLIFISISLFKNIKKLNTNLKSTESKKLESSFLTVCIIGGIGALAYWGLDKIGLFGKKEDILIEKAILKNEILKNEILRNQVVDNLIINKEQSTNELFKNQIIIERISSVLEKKKAIIENAIVLSEYNIQKFENEIKNLNNEYLKNEKSITNLFRDYDFYQESNKKLMSEKEVIEKRQDLLNLLLKGGYIQHMSEFFNNEQKLLNLNNEIMINNQKLKKIESKSEIFYKSFEEIFEIIRKKKIEMSTHNSNKQSSLSYYNKITQELTVNNNNMAQLKKKVEELTVNDNNIVQLKKKIEE